jgi:hypothetical protein
VLLDETEVLFGMLLDAVQAGFQVLAPSLEFVAGEAGLGEGGCRGGLGGEAGPVVDDLVDQMFAFLELCSALAADFDVGAAGAADGGSGWTHG